MEIIAKTAETTTDTFAGIGNNQDNSSKDSKSSSSSSSSCNNNSEGRQLEELYVSGAGTVLNIVKSRGLGTVIHVVVRHGQVVNR